jgi:hypothetical protein
MAYFNLPTIPEPQIAGIDAEGVITIIWSEEMQSFDPQIEMKGR